MKYVVDWSMNGKISIDTDGTDWSAEEFVATLTSAFAEAAEKVGRHIEEEFEDCDVDGSGEVDVQPRRIT